MNLIEISNPEDYDSSMLLAAKTSESSKVRFQLGAVIKYGKSKVAAYNSSKTHSSFGCGRYRSLHAESYCILKALKNGFDLSRSVLYVYRSQGLNCKPCKDCEALIKRFRIKKVYYTNVKSGDISKT